MLRVDPSNEFDKAQSGGSAEQPAWSYQEVAEIYRSLEQEDVEKLGKLYESLSRQEDLAREVGSNADLSSELRTFNQELQQRIQEEYPQVNGDVDAFVEALGMHRQELLAQKEWKESKESQNIPARVWETIKKHKKLALLVTIGLGGAALYYSGLGALALGRLKDLVLLNFASEIAAVQEWASATFAGAEEAVAAAAEQTAELAAEGQEAATGLLEKAEGAAAAAEGATGEGVVEVGEGAVDLTPGSQPLPSELPTVDESLRILDQADSAW